MEPISEDMVFVASPATVGYWSMWESTRYYVTKRPRWLTRLMMRWFFEWEWNDQWP